VTTARYMLPPEVNTLAIMKWRFEQMAPGNRWYPVLLRYIKYIAGRVDGLGGNSSSVPPSPWGFWLPPKQKRVVLKVWRRNDIICDNAGEIDYLANSGWTVAATEKLCEDITSGTSEVLYLLTNAFPDVPPPPVLTVPNAINVPAGSTMLLSCSMTRGRMILRKLDEPKSADIEIDPSPASYFPSPATGLISLSFDVPGGIAPSRYLALLCINDTAPVEMDGFGQACWATVHVELYCPNSPLAPPNNPQVVIAKDQIPGGQSQVYYLVINAS